MNYLQLDTIFAKFSALLLEQHQSEFKSMNHGFFKEHEQYKYEVCKKANEILSIDKWNEDEIGRGKIQEQIIKAIEIKQNNLVRWQNKYGEEKTSHYKIKSASGVELEQMEKSLFNLFKTESDEDTFTTLVNLIGKRYDVIAYLFFIKNSKDYLPIAPSIFDKAFNKIGLVFKTSHQCGWENYSRYLKAIKEVQNYLKSKLIGDVSLLDAHSFLWSIAKRDLEKGCIQDNEITGEELILGKLTQKKPTPRKQQSLIGIDYLERHRNNMILGQKAEEVVVNYEIERLSRLGRNDLAKRVNREPAIDASLGFDVESFEANGDVKQIEVKAVSSKQFFYRGMSCKNLNNWIITICILCMM